MVVRNKMSRFHLCMEALRRSDYPKAGPLMEWCQEMLAKHQTYTREHFEDMPEVRDWVWTDMEPSALRQVLPAGKERCDGNLSK
jgi:xylulose-5-phosphate/fructose-6-phosphate phosphoketolase